jgi:ABC-type dipeptide/oligopeptide/nickel transport system permease component
MAALMRFTRSSLLEALRQDYVRTRAPRGSPTAASCGATRSATR